MIDDRLWALDKIVGHLLPATQRQDFVDFIRVGEEGLALDTLAWALAEEEQPVPSAVRDEMMALADLMGINEQISRHLTFGPDIVEPQIRCMSAEREELARLVQEIPEDQVPLAVEKMRRLLRPVSDGGSRNGSTALMNDPALRVAAATVEPMLEMSFPDTYAGLWPDHQQHVMTIYRRPDPALDAAVRAKIPQVRVVFRAARFSLARLRQLRDHIVADQAYWSRCGISIQMVAPMVDGSGVLVGTLRGAPEEAALLSQRYGPETVTVEKRFFVDA